MLLAHPRTNEFLSNGEDSGGIMSEIIIYEDKSGKLSLDVRLDNDTVWLTQLQMAELFDTTQQNIALHLKNVFSEGELDQKATYKDFLLVRNEGGRAVNRNVAHYNLDGIISVGYRVNSKKAVMFRQWATSVLKEYLVKGFTLNPDRLAILGVKEVQDSLEMPARTLDRQPELSSESRQIIQLIHNYAKTWTTLFQYDEGSIPIPPGKSPRERIDYSDAVRDIQLFKRTLIEKGEAGTLFGQERENAFRAIIGNLEQDVFGEPCYKSVEEKAANLLYFIVKDHPFSDGNKRIGTFMFLRYLESQGVRHDFGPGALPALTLLVAESPPTSKDLMVRIVINAISAISTMVRCENGEDVRLIGAGGNRAEPLPHPPENGSAPGGPRS